MSIKLRSTSIILSILILVLLPTVVLAVDNPINIDGYYDDWEDKPHTPISHGGWDGKDVHSAALFLAGERLYGHIKMNDSHGTKLQFSSMKLSVNDNFKIDFFIGNKNSDNTINWGGNINKLPQGITLDLAIFDNQNKKAWLGDAAISIYDQKGDETEFFIDLESIRSLCDNISIDEMRTFTLSCPNIGKEDITISGTSTAPFIGVAVSLVVVGYILFRKKEVDGTMI